MSWFVVHIPDNQPGELTDHVDDVTAALAEHYRGPILGMRIETQDALNAGWCDACPTDCTQCTGDRASCECYQHDTPQAVDRG